ncbi:ankyrin repeat domain-containing protein [Endozoicomonas sp. SESOKO1]|uniref:ankyrin repeat domain-containing protein n=1 Tax=Endozoicomonas sp. SESOKO1 TaxID=2828742 RepID=UPI0021476DFE|nr:ankyrin repeat domain-containing protein [Endozoicomonas sp. SESOKO1]
MSNPLSNVTSSLAPNYPSAEASTASGHVLPESNNSRVQALADATPCLPKQPATDAPDIAARQVTASQDKAPVPMDLWRAVKAQDVDQIKTLINTHKINPDNVFDSPRTGCWTPLCYAAYHHHENVVAALVENGANVDALYRVRHSPHVKADFSFYDDNLWNALGFCAASGNVKACELLLAHQPGSLCSVMDHSLDCGRYSGEVIETLLKAGANPNGGIAPDSKDGTPLASAASQARTKELELLLTYRADPNRGCPKPICKAVLWGGEGNPLTRLLIQHGAVFEPYYNYDEPQRVFPYREHNRWLKDQAILHELRSVHAELFTEQQGKI